MLNDIFFPLFFIFALIFGVYGGSTNGDDYCKKGGSKGRIVGGNEARPGTLKYPGQSNRLTVKSPVSTHVTN